MALTWFVEMVEVVCRESYVVGGCSPGSCSVVCVFVSLEDEEVLLRSKSRRLYALGRVTVEHY